MNKDLKEILKTTVMDKKGQTLDITLAIYIKSYCPDLFVFHSITDYQLFDDNVFINNIMKILKTLNYKGQDFDRAELGLQSSRYIVLEGNDDFGRFITEKYNWCDLTKMTD